MAKEAPTRSFAKKRFIQTIVQGRHLGQQFLGKPGSSVACQHRFETHGSEALRSIEVALISINLVQTAAAPTIGSSALPTCFDRTQDQLGHLLAVLELGKLHSTLCAAQSRFRTQTDEEDIRSSMFPSCRRNSALKSHKFKGRHVPFVSVPSKFLRQLKQLACLNTIFKI